MAFSYSFHMSAKSHAVNTIGKVTQVSRHNLREYESKDYDKSQIEILRGSDSSILDDVKRIYHDEFDEPVKRYNEGKRADRQIEDYLQHVSDSRSDVACEFIIQVGDKDFWENKTMDERKQMTFIFRDQLRALEKLVPELKVASAVIHYDESSPHIHVVGVPVAEGYKKGLEKQVAKTKVFTKERLSYLQDKLRENAERGMQLPENQNLFAEHALKPKEKGRNKDIPKHVLEEYEKKKAEIAKLDEKIQSRKDKIKELNKEGKGVVAELNQNITELGKTKKKLDNANDELKAILDEKARASEIKGSGLLAALSGEETVSYHKNMLESTRNIGTEAWQRNRDTVEKLDAIVDREEAVKKKEAEINPLWEDADKAKKQYEYLQRSQERLIEDRAKVLSQRRIDAFKRKVLNFLDRVAPSIKTLLEEFLKKEDRDISR